MKLEFTKEQHAEFIKNHFQVVTGYVLDENNELDIFRLEWLNS